MRDSIDSARITELLRKVRGGDALAHEELAPFLYSELRRLARTCMRRERPDHTLQTTALVHEAYLRLMGDQRVAWQDRKHFFSVAAGVMRRVLVDHARTRKAGKRGGGVAAISLARMREPAACESWDKILDLHNALTRLADVDARAARVVELRFFAGLEISEMAELLQISDRTVKRDWEFAQSWLFADIAAAYGNRENEQRMSRPTPKTRN